MTRPSTGHHDHRVRRTDVLIHLSTRPGEALVLTGRRNPDQEAQTLRVISTLAHELRAPLHALAASSERLGQAADILTAGEVGSMIVAIRQRIIWLQGLVENMACAPAALSPAAGPARRGIVPDTGEPHRDRGDLGLHLRPQFFSTREVIADVCAVIEPLMQQRSQSLRLRLARGDTQMWGDPRRVGQALINLLVNASKYSGPATTIDVHLIRRRGGLRIQVGDRGPGLPPGKRRRLFALFYRAPEALHAGKDGVGLGLAIVQAIVHAHSGRVGASNRRDGGARFWFDLPLRAPDFAS